MLKQMMRKTAGIFTATAVIVAGLVSMPTTAFADEPQQQPLDPPTSATLIVDSVDATNAVLKTTLDKPLEDSQSTLSLYKTGDPVTQQTATIGTEITFTVPRPTTTEYEQYYVTVGTVTSNTATVTSATAAWEINVSVQDNKTQYATGEVPIINWSTNQPVETAGKFVYFVDQEDGKIIRRAYNGQQGSDTINTTVSGGAKQYYLVIADGNWVAQNESQLANISTKSNSIMFTRKPWTVNLTVDKSIFSTDDTNPTFTWTTNQEVLPYYSPGNYSVFIANAETDEIVYVHNYNPYPQGSGTYQTRFYNGEAKEYVAYVAEFNYQQYYSTVADLVGIQATSQTISIERKAWELTMTIDQEEFSTDSTTPKITWLANQGLQNTNANYALYFGNKDTGEIFNVISSGDSGEITIPRFYNGETKQYIAYIAKAPTYSVGYNNLSELVDIQATSNTVSTSRIAWQITAELPSPSFTTDDPTPKVAWEANQSLSGSNGAYNLYLVDDNTNEILNSYDQGSSGEIEIRRFYTGGARTYKVYVAKGDYGYNGIWPATVEELEDIQAVSNSVTTQRAPWTLDIQIDNENFYTDDATPRISWQTNQSLMPKGDYWVYFAETETGKIIGQAYYNASWIPIASGAVNIQRFYTEESKTYRAYVAKSAEGVENVSQLEDIQASSGTVTTARQPWTLSLDIDRTVFSTDDPSPVITWTTNQTIKGSAYNYVVYLIDLTTHDVVGISQQPYYGDTPAGGNWTVRFETGGPHAYQAYVAKGGNAYDPTVQWPQKLSDLEDIQAVSGGVSTKRANWNISLMITDAVPLYFDDEDSENDQIEYTLVWNTNQTVNRRAYDYYIYNGNYRAFSDVSWNWTGNQMSAKVRVPATVQSNFVAYVAKKEEYGEFFTNANQLEDIQAISTDVSPQEISQSILNQRYMGGGNPSEGNCNQQCYGDPVNSYNGEFFENETDLSISSAIPFNFSRSYSTTGLGKEGAFGDGWTFNYNMKINSEENLPLIDSQKITIVQENGSIVKFSKGISNGENVYVSPSNVLADLKHDEINNKFLFKRRGTSQTYVFNDSTGVLEQITDTNGNYLNLTYTNSKLTQIVNNENKTLTINWVNNRIASITDGSRIVAYSYSTENNVNIIDFPDIEGNKQYVYDTTTNQITGVVHPGGAAYHNEYDLNGKVIKQTDPLAGETLFTYTGNETTITLPDGTVTKEKYNQKGQLIEKKLAVGSPLETSYTYQYDFTGQVSAEYGPDGLTVAYNHDYYGNTLSVRNALNHTYGFTYNSNNQLVETTNPLGQKSVNKYDDKGNLIETKTFGGAITKYEVNPNGSNHTIQSPVDTALNNNKKIFFSYDTNGHLASTTTPNGGTVSVVNDNLGNPTQTTNTLGQTTTYSYNSYKQLTKVEAPNGAETEKEYDNAGRVTKETDTLGRETFYTYDLMNKLTSVTTVLGTIEYEYDINGRLLKQINVDGTESSYQYDDLGRTTSVTDPNGNTTTNNYYANSLLKSTTDAQGNTTTYEYDAVGNLTKTIDASQNETTAVYDSLNRLISTTSSNGYIETYEYDNDSQLIKTTKAGVETTHYEYDPNGNLIKTTYPDTSFELRTYNSNNSLTTVTDRDGKVTSYEYDAAGQLIKTTRPDLTEEVYSYTTMGQVDKISYDNWATIDTEYVYDIAGRITNAFKNGVETTYSYDTIGNLTRRGPPVGNGVQYDYNQYGELNKLTYPSGIELEYTYDNNGNLLTINYDNETLAEYTYDANNNNTRVDYGNGTFEEYDYDDLNRLSQFSVNNQNSELYKKQLELNSTGFIIGTKTDVNTSNVEDKTYSYTNVQRLENVTNNITNDINTYAFDISSNLTSSQLGTNTFTANGQLNTNVLENVAASYSYDLRGNRTAAQFVDAINTNKTKNIAYSWSNDNKLTNHTTTAIQVEGNKTTTDITDIDYTYDISGLVTGKTRSYESTVVEPAGSISSLVVTADSYKWDTSRSVPTLLEDNTNNYVYGLGSAPFAQITKNTGGILAGIEYLHADERGSIIASTTDTGVLSWTRSYDEYGSVIEETPNIGVAQVETPFAYVGEYLDSDTGLYNLRARWYEPNTASFISIDPALLSTGESYSYASANPLSNTDPLGLFAMAALAVMAFDTYAPTGVKSAVAGVAQEAYNGVVGTLDGVTGIPIASSISNWLIPGSVKTCSVAYQVGYGVGFVASFAIPVVKGVGLVAALGYGVYKVATKVVAKGFANTQAVRRVTEIIQSATKTADEEWLKKSQTLITTLKNHIANKAPNNMEEVLNLIKPLTTHSSGNKNVNSAHTLETLSEILKIKAKPYKGELLGSGFPGTQYILSDNSRIGLRTKSATGGATIDLYRPGAKKGFLKIHIDPNSGA